MYSDVHNYDLMFPLIMMRLVVLHIRMLVSIYAYIHKYMAATAAVRTIIAPNRFFSLACAFSGADSL